MSKLTEIERALQSVDPAAFQRLCDAYLYEQGYRNINPIGLVIGADKVKRGTPDSLVPMANGHYTFAEYTTQQTDVGKKLRADMAKCFDETKTGIPADRIQQFVACHNSVLDPAEEHQLQEAGRERGCLVIVFGLGPMAHDLLQRFPGLARTFLGVELDTGQILTIDEFVAAYGKSAVATPLDTAIRFRDDEITRALQDLDSNDVLIVTGPAGVGKSRLALEICRRFAQEHQEVQPRAILYRGIDLYQDVRTYFTTSGCHLVLVDDANRVGGFEHLLRLLHEQRADRQVKIIVTVRSYALDKVTDDLRPYRANSILRINGLKDEHIREILTKDFGIANHLYCERIVELAQGNPRLAVMAAGVATREQTLLSLADVSALYDEYFGSIRKDITDLRDPEVLTAAGIIALFRHVDRKNDTQLTVIADAFQVTSEQLWRGVQRLHERELVDLYEDEVVRISDQVLATYLFHLAFFRERILDPEGFFCAAFFPQYQSRLFDALNPAISAFDGPAIADAIQPAIRSRWAALEAAGEEDTLLHLVNAFGAIEATDTLTYLRDRIAGAPAEPQDISTVVFKAAASSGLSLWTVLGTLRGNDLPVVKMVVALALHLLARRPGEMPQALSLFTECLSLRHDSHFRDYEVQCAVIDGLWSRVHAPDGTTVDLFLRLFLLTAAPMLHTHFLSHEAKNEKSIRILTFDIADTAALRSLRQDIWRRLGVLLKGTHTRALALEVVREHTRTAHQVTNPRLLASDAEVALPILDQALDPSSYADSSVVQAYLQLLHTREVTLDVALEERTRTMRGRYAGPTHQLARLLVDDDGDRNERANSSWREVEEQRRRDLADYIADRDLASLDQLIADCVVINRELQAECAARGEAQSSNRREWQFKHSVTTMLQAVAQRDPALFVQIVEHYLQLGDPLELPAYGILPAVLAAAGVERTQALLHASDFRHRGAWLTGFFALLPDESITPEHVAQLYDHLDSATMADLFREVDFLTKYERHDRRVVPRIVAMLVTKADTDPQFGRILAEMFEANGAVGRRLREIFGGSFADVALLKRAYCAASASEQHFDHDAAAFSLMIDLDPAFGIEWIKWRHRASPKGYLSRHDEHRDYTDLWLRPDYATVMRAMLSCLQREQEYDFSYADVFVAVRGEERRAPEIRVRQRDLFHAWIAEAADDMEQMVFVFARAVGLAEVDRRDLLTAFLERNHRLSDFEQLPLERSDGSWWGSEVPLLGMRREFLESLLPLFDRIEFLDHRKRIEQRIAGVRSAIEVERKRDFLER
ncbi:MAG: nSTAND3 domain-containing NTPase [Gemmatimonadaceae bacterium]